MQQQFLGFIPRKTIPDCEKGHIASLAWVTHPWVSGSELRRVDTIPMVAEPLLKLRAEWHSDTGTGTKVKDNMASSARYYSLDFAVINLI